MWPALLGLVAGVVVFLLALGGGRLAPRLGSHSFADATTVTGLAANIVLLFLAVVALLVAGAAYREAHDTDVQQQKTFDEQQLALSHSRDALAAVVGQLNEQRKLIDAAVATLREQLKLVQDAHEEERRRIARKPIIDIRVGEITGAQLNSLIRVDIDAQSYTPIDFLISNRGDADLPAPTVVIQAFPPSVFVDERGIHIPERPDHNVLQMSPGNIVAKGEPVRCSVDVKVPLDVVEFHIAVSVFREGFSAATRNFRFGQGRRQRAGKI
jgi:uncharacterized iron-regulated membrane protein